MTIAGRIIPLRDAYRQTDHVFELGLGEEGGWVGEGRVLRTCIEREG